MVERMDMYQIFLCLRYVLQAEALWWADLPPKKFNHIAEAIIFSDAILN